MTDRVVTIEGARSEVRRLVELQRAKQTELAALRAELERLDRGRGALALAAVDSGNVKAVQAATAEVAAMRGQVETTEALLGALEVRLGEARERQRRAVVAAMHKRADAITAEVEKRKAERGRLCQLLFELEGTAAALDPQQTKTERLASRAEQMRNAADLFVARGLDCPRDQETGLALNEGLW